MTTRREFLGTCAALGAAPVLSAAPAPKKDRPNIVYIFTDQQSATMMSCAGNRRLKTPAMDYIAARGIRFARAYTTNPVCVPARIGMMTGRFPGAFSCPQGQVRENGFGMRVPRISEAVEKTTVPALLAKAGYDLAYGGKVHLPKPLNPKQLGFRILTGNQRDGLGKACAAYIREKHDKPFYLVASFINPHDICYMALRHMDFDHRGTPPKGRVPPPLLEAMKLPAGVSEKEFLEKHCPPLPPNIEPQAGEPAAVRWLLNRRSFRIRARKEYTDRDWRLHRWAYLRLTEMVDRQIRDILDALGDSGLEENTVVIFTSDHGDMDAAHRMEHKSTLYEEAANIPFLVMHPAAAPAGRVNTTHLVSNGLDLLPTLCDYAGAAGAADPRGRSLRPLIEGKPARWRETLGVESEIGRMVVAADGCKYARYDRDKDEEQLLDLTKDPRETRHFTAEKSHAGRLAALRKAFAQWFPDFA